MPHRADHRSSLRCPKDWVTKDRLNENPREAQEAWEYPGQVGCLKEGWVSLGRTLASEVCSKPTGFRNPAEGLKARLGGRSLSEYCLGRSDEASRSKAFLGPEA